MWYYFHSFMLFAIVTLGLTSHMRGELLGLTLALLFKQKLLAWSPILYVRSRALVVVALVLYNLPCPPRLNAGARALS